MCLIFVRLKARVMMGSQQLWMSYMVVNARGLTLKNLNLQALLMCLSLKGPAML